MTSEKLRPCSKKGCHNVAQVRVFVSTVEQQSTYSACKEHAAKFGEDLADMLQLPYAAEWSIRIYSLQLGERAI